MVTSQAKTPEEYIAELPPDRAMAISRVRDVVRRHLPEGYEEGLDLIGDAIARTPVDRYIAHYRASRGE